MLAGIANIVGENPIVAQFNQGPPALSLGGSFHFRRVFSFPRWFPAIRYPTHLSQGMMQRAVGTDAMAGLYSQQPETAQP